MADMTPEELRQLINEIDFGKDTLKQTQAQSASPHNFIPQFPGAAIEVGVIISAENDECIFCTKEIDGPHDHAIAVLEDSNEEVVGAYAFCVHKGCHRANIAIGNADIVVMAAAKRLHKERIHNASKHTS